jgi:hypothetical protein
MRARQAFEQVLEEGMLMARFGRFYALLSTRDRRTLSRHAAARTIL